MTFAIRKPLVAAVVICGVYIRKTPSSKILTLYEYYLKVRKSMLPNNPIIFHNDVLCRLNKEQTDK